MDIFERLNSVSNSACHKHCNAEKRDSVTENEICGIVSSVEDGLPVRCVGEWAYEKINLLVKYFGAFTVAMKGKWAGGINYIEICSGPGRCMDRSRGREFDGTSLAILHHKEFSRLSKAIFFDADMNVVNTLNKRILGRNITSAKVFNGDYYNAREICKRLATEIQKSSLNLVFIDPTDCSVPFDLIKSLKETIPKMDLIINVASMIDFNRNVGNVFLQPESYIKSKEKYVRFLGSEEFFGDTANLNNATLSRWVALRTAFRKTYQKNLEKHFIDWCPRTETTSLMMAETNIEWTEFTWNPSTGCTKISSGCKNCYAEKMTKRLTAMGIEKYQTGFDLAWHEFELTRPYSIRQPRMIFVNSMSDLFHEDMPLDFIRKVFKVMNECPQHIFQVLTKRADILGQYSTLLNWTPNIWMGVTVERSKYKDRINHLRQSGAFVKFLSLEPLLSSLDELDLRDIDWVIVGGESGPNARPMNKSWVVEIQTQCRNSQIPFFFKQWGGVNKKAAGSLLEGKYYKEMPAIIHPAPLL